MGSCYEIAFSLQIVSLDWLYGFWWHHDACNRDTWRPKHSIPPRVSPTSWLQSRYHEK